MKEQFGILGLGAAGSNIANLFEGKGYTTMYVNSSIEDLNCIKGVHKVMIPGAEGAAKNRKRVLQLAMESFGDIVQKIESVITQQYVVVIFSAGGGTGSGLSIPILKYLTQIGKTCIPVMILPDGHSSAKVNENAYNASVELMSIQGLGATFLLDNSRGDKFAINSRFACELDSFINLQNSSIHGNIDKAERKQMLSCPGVAVIGKVSKTKSVASELVESLYNGIHAEITSKNAYYLGVSTSNRSLDIESITSTFSSVYDVFSGASEATSIIIATGLQFPQKRIVAFKNKFEETVKTMNDTNAMQNFEPLEPLKGLSFTPTAIQPQAPTSPRDILLGLLGNN
jgi:cell division GTPase FtsZ